MYNYPPPAFGPEHEPLAERFVQSYIECPPGFDHSTVVVSNGGPPSETAIKQFGSGVQFLQRENAGMDIGAYQLAALSIDCDLMVFFGGSCYFRVPGWLSRIVYVFDTFGHDNLYGASGYHGHGTDLPHIRTTAFWCSPNLINEHPFRVDNSEQRYPYEHGPEGLTSWVLATGRKAFVVGMMHIAPVTECNLLTEGAHQGRQRDLLIGDRWTCPPFYDFP